VTPEASSPGEADGQDLPGRHGLSAKRLLLVGD
jgi:hypothetical protein